MRVVLTKTKWRSVFMTAGNVPAFKAEMDAITAASKGADEQFMPVEFEDTAKVLELGRLCKEDWIVRCAETVLYTDI